MSRIYFHARHRTAEVGGSERAYFSALANDMTLALLRLDAQRDVEWMRDVTFNPPDYLAEAMARPMPDVMTDRHAYIEWARWPDMWATWARVGCDEGSGLRVDGEVIPFGEMALNTLVAMNSPQLAFAAHVHGCCETYGYIPAKNAGWLANLIEKGRRERVFRKGQGWDDVIALAREVAAEGAGPIVMSYSVCEKFPNPGVAAWEPPDADDATYDAWYDLPEAERWELGVRAITARKWPFALGPDRQRQGFLSGASVFDLLDSRWTGQLAGRA